MKKFVLSVAMTAAFASAAVAADLPVKSRALAPAPMPVASWTGCYVGAGGGYGMYNQDIQTVTAPTGSGTTTVGGRGWFGTVQVGCDYQFADRWVIGAFGDWDFRGQKSTATWALGTTTPVTAFQTFQAGEKNKWAWAAGARLGYAVFPQLLAYVSGGYTESRYTFDPIIGSFTGVASANFLPDVTYKGWFLGTGYEYGVSFLPGLFWKTEYRYASFRAQDIPFTVVSTGLATGTLLHTEKFEQTIRSELVYRFNWGGGGPVVARY
jgi:outer membrane immunogenic protein